MKHIKVSTVVLALLLCLGCKKAAPPCQSDIFLGEDCEKYSQRIYPQFDISGEPLAWYSATVEGQSTSMAGERNGMGYIAGQKQVILTTDPSITTGSSSGERFFSFRFWPTLQHEFTGKLPGILEFYSPAFSVGPSLDPIAAADSLFAPAPKMVDSGDKTSGGWVVVLALVNQLPTQINKSWGSRLLSTRGRVRPSSYNRLEITKLEKEDLGAWMRYHIWFNFQAEIHDGDMPISRPGPFFTYVENGKAKLYVDIQK